VNRFRVVFVAALGLTAPTVAMGAALFTVRAIVQVPSLDAVADALLESAFRSGSGLVHPQRPEIRPHYTGNG
jgi:hypothetical protein